MSGKKTVAAALAGAESASAPPPPPPPVRLATRFEMRADGLYRRSGKDDAPDLWVCGPFEVLTETRDADQGMWGILLRWRDRDGHEHRDAIPRAMFAGEGGELRARLADGGLSLSPRNDARQALLEYLAAINSPHRAVCVPRIGWHRLAGRRVFVLPDEVFGAAAGSVILQAPSREPSLFGQAGTLEGWQAEIAARCLGNHRLMLAVCTAFASPLLDLLGEDGGGIHLYGRSRAGKTTLLRVAASVCGGNAESGAGAFVRTWRSTGNAIEGTAAAHADALLPLDEIGQADGADIGETAYLLGNGQGKARLDRSAGLRAPLRFRLLFLSTGEQTLAAKIAEAKKTIRAGMEVRMIDLPAAPAGGAGVFECWPIDGSAGALAQALASATREHYGRPFRVFLRHLMRLHDDGEDLAAELKMDVEARVARWVKPDADGQVRSVGRRFALIAQAGLIAGEAGVTGWTDDLVEAAIFACFASWLEARGSSGAREDMQAADQLRAFMAAHGSSRFETWAEAAPEAQNPSAEPPIERFRTMNRVGWRRWEIDQAGVGGWRHYMTPDGMRETLAGLDYKPALADLVRRGLILPGGDGRSSALMTVRGYGKQRLYRISPDALSAGEREASPEPPPETSALPA
jgi:putative DNA primase/helicase